MSTEQIRIGYIKYVIEDRQRNFKIQYFNWQESVTF